MSGIEWSDPPPDARGVSTWKPILDALRERPGKWAIVRRFQKQNTAAATASRLKAGLYGGAEAGEFEATSRNAGDEYLVYARYVGKEATR